MKLDQFINYVHLRSLKKYAKKITASGVLNFWDKRNYITQNTLLNFVSMECERNKKITKSQRNIRVSCDISNTNFPSLYIFIRNIFSFLPT